jgi:hypothetical protein
MKTFKKHHNEDLDGTKGAWRPSLVVGMTGADGHPVSWNEIAVVSCPSCGAPQGVGADGVTIRPDGTTDGPVKCYNCPWQDGMTFEKHQEPEGREHFARLKEEAANGVKEARVRVMQEAIKRQTLEELDQKAWDEARKVIPDGAPNPQDLFNTFMKGRNSR